MKKKDFMKKLLYFMKDYKKESVLAPLFKMLEAFFELFVPLVVASIIDDGIVPKDSGRSMGLRKTSGNLLQFVFMWRRNR